jgi:hypothetical protein
MPGSRVDSGLRPECANSRHSPAGVNRSNRPTAGAPFRSRCERKAPTPFELACHAERGHAVPLSRRGLEASVRSLGAGPRLRPYLAAWERVSVEIAVPRGSSICSSMILLKLIVAPSGPHASPILLQEVGQPIPGPTARHIVGPATRHGGRCCGAWGAHVGSRRQQTAGRLGVRAIQPVAADPAAGRELAARGARLLQSTAAASSLSHARKARTLADSRRFLAQTKQ